MRIGELARKSGIAASAVRYYERAGLLPRTARTTGGYREYDEEEALGRLDFIRKAKHVGFSLLEIRELIGEPRVRSTGERDVLRATIARKLTEVRAKRTTLKTVERQLSSLAVRLARVQQTQLAGAETLTSWLFLDGEVSNMAGCVTGWLLAGTRRDCYEIGVALGEASAGKPAAYLRSTTDPSGGFGTLMQQIVVDEFAGKRLRFSGAVRAEAVIDWAGLWMRVDGAREDPMLAFDNMHDRAIKGSTDWSRYAVVLDVPEKATNIAFGVLLSGEGAIWIADLALEAVGVDVPTTGEWRRASKPLNLDFSEPQTASQRTVEPPARVRELPSASRRRPGPPSRSRRR